jgi:uncharacterized membrane protein
MTRPLARGLEKNRIEALVDGVFAVALTLLVLDIRLPEGVVAPTDAALAAQLATLERHFVIYVVTFIVVGVYWINHHIQFHFIEHTNRSLIWINLGYLMVVSFLPFATDLVGDHEKLVLPCEIYGIALLILTATSLSHIHYLARHPELTSADFTPEIVTLLRRRSALFALVPTISMAVAFVSTRAAIYAYVLLGALHFIPGRIDHRIARAENAAQEATPQS